MREAYSQATYIRVKIKVIKFKLDKDPLHQRVYFLSLMNPLKIILSQFSEEYMILMEYPSIWGEKVPDYAENSIWNLLQAYIDAHTQKFIDECPGDGVQDISRFQSQCANMKFSDQNRYNIMFKKVVHKGEESAINYIKRFKSVNALGISVGNIYTEYQLMHTYLDTSHKGGK